VSRSMSRYHRRPTASHATPPKAPPLRSATLNVPPPEAAQVSTAAARNRAQSSPQTRNPSNVQPRPNTSRTREAATATSPGERPRPRTARDEAKQLLQDEHDRQRRLREKLEAEKREKLRAEQAKQAEQARREQQRAEEDLERLRAQREAEDAEQLRQQQHEKERGTRLQKAESSKRLREREDAERQARAEEATRKEHASPSTSPRRHRGFTLFKRPSDSPQSPPQASPPSKPPPTSYSNRDMDNIKAGGGGAVLGIDAPVSAVNAGDRVSCSLLIIYALLTVTARHHCLQQKAFPAPHHP
jgi:hypothetical protein